jgi:hypothetical protein
MRVFPIFDDDDDGTFLSILTVALQIKINELDMARMSASDGIDTPFVCIPTS